MVVQHSSAGADAPATVPKAPSRVSLRGVSKTFGPVKALVDVALEIRPGEVHGLVGQNGSGKSTLIKVLSGVYEADPGGVVTAGGHELSSPVRPMELRRAGLAFVHQDLGLVGEQSVVENMRVGLHRCRRFGRRIDWKHERAVVTETLGRLHARFGPDVLVNTLRPGDRALVAIGRALQSLETGEGCIVFDESTQALPRDTLPDFYATVRRLAAEGTAVIIVSHRLDEIMVLADRVTVLRDGCVAAGGLPTAELTEHELASIVLGDEARLAGLQQRIPAAVGSGERAGIPRLHIDHLEGDQLSGFGLVAHAGEVVGITGATNSGHEELPYALSGHLASSRGTVTIDGEAIEMPVAGAHAMIARGVALVPEQRAREGLALSLSAEENLTLPRVLRRGRARLRSDWQAAEFEKAAEMLGIVPFRPHMPISSYSGGNQQKVMLAKWLLNEPRILVLHEPTQAVDVGARMDILRAIRAAAAEGVCALVSSIEPQDLAFVCDRVIVVRGGAPVRELAGDDLTAAAITAAIYDQPKVAALGAGDRKYGGKA